MVVRKFSIYKLKQKRAKKLKINNTRLLEHLIHTNTP